MFILTPLLLILASLVGIFVIVYRKKPYLKKLLASGNGREISLNAEVAFGPSFSWKKYGAEFFPEIKVFFERMKLQEYTAMWLIEVEKLLRKIRLFFLRIDGVSDILIKKIRRIHLNGQSAQSSPEDNLSGSAQEAERQETISPAFLKNEEERLIIEIAKNPKDYHLYEVLGDLYLEMANLRDAKESYEAALELDTNNEEIKKKLSRALEKLT